jgi:hypothetical protein
MLRDVDEQLSLCEFFELIGICHPHDHLCDEIMRNFVIDCLPAYFYIDEPFWLLVSLSEEKP